MSPLQEVAKMKTLSLPLLTAAAIAFSPAEGRAGSGVFQDEPADGLERYRWSHRPVLLFAPSEQAPAYVEQRAALGEAVDELVERDIVVLIDTDPSGQGPLRTSFGAKGFEVLLIGKDGGVKLRQQAPVGTDVLFAVIDAMPMRRQEMGK
jgi:hypothetical protein